MSFPSVTTKQIYPSFTSSTHPEQSTSHGKIFSRRQHTDHSLLVVSTAILTIGIASTALPKPKKLPPRGYTLQTITTQPPHPYVRQKQTKGDKGISPLISRREDRKEYNSYKKRCSNRLSSVEKQSEQEPTKKCASKTTRLQHNNNSKERKIERQRQRDEKYCASNTFLLNESNVDVPPFLNVKRTTAFVLAELKKHNIDLLIFASLKPTLFNPSIFNQDSTKEGSMKNFDYSVISDIVKTVFPNPWKKNFSTWLTHHQNKNYYGDSNPIDSESENSIESSSVSSEDSYDSSSEDHNNYPWSEVENPQLIDLFLEELPYFSDDDPIDSEGEGLNSQSSASDSESEINLKSLFKNNGISQ